MFDRFERTVRRTLRQIARQRVRMVLQPGGFWVVDRAAPEHKDKQAALLTCYMRGWVEPLENAIPTKQIDFENPLDMRGAELETQYRLTSAGWSIIHRSSTI